MANNFETLKSKVSTKKFNLIRIEPARNISGDLVLLSGTTYTCTFAFTELSRIRVSAGSSQRVFVTPNAGEHTFDDDTKLITINLGVPLTNQVVVAFYFLFYTKDETQIAYENPQNSSTPYRTWQPRIAEESSFQFNIKEIINGYLSFGSSNLSLYNQDDDFQKYLTNNDSFANKVITIWLCLNTVDNVKLVYRGLVNRITVSDRVSIEFFDEFSNLSKTFYSNNFYISSTFNSTKFPNVHPAKENLPMRRAYAVITTYKVIDDGLAVGLYTLSPSSLLEAICIDYNVAISNSTNRSWGTLLNGGDHGVQTDIVSVVDNTDPNYTLITHGNTKYYRIGDTLQIGTESVRVYYADTILFQIKVTKNLSVLVLDTITRSGISTIVITQDNNNYYALYGRDYTVSNTGNPNNVIKVIFANNFEANFPGMLDLSPDQHLVRFRAWIDTTATFSHGDVMGNLLGQAGLTVNTASLTNANLTPLTTNFYIPYIDSSDFGTFSSYVEDLLQSTLGYLSLNNDLEIEYHLFETLAPTNELSSREILLRSFSTRIDYNDIKNSITPNNPHDIIELGYTNPGTEDNVATYLHEAKSGKVYKHILSDISRMSDVFGIITNRTATYKLTTKVNPDVIIGDEFQVTRDRKLIGEDSYKNIKVISINKKSNEVELECSDLLGL